MGFSSPELLRSCRTLASDRGFGLFGVVRAAEFDRCQPAGGRAGDLRPGTGTIVVLGHGGSGGWEAMVARDGDPGAPRRNHHPIDDFSRRAAALLADHLAVEGHESRIVLPSDRRTLSFLQLGEEAGFGTISPAIGLLIHPRFGPWISLRAALLVDGEPFGKGAWSRSIAGDFQPCATCSRPCLQVCPSGAFQDGADGPDLVRCIEHRHEGGCADGCDVRRACPIGAGERFGAREESFRHAYSLFLGRKALGLGAWRYVPRTLRPYL